MQINPIRTDASNDFAHDSFASRLPQILRDIQADKHYSKSLNEAIDALYEQLRGDAPLPPPPLTAPDAQTWLEEYEKHKGESWQNTEWFFAETYFFHLINDIMRFWQYRQDPFEDPKREEVQSADFRTRLENLPMLEANAESLSKLLAMSLWGNRVDMSLPDVMKNQTQEVSSEDLLVDDCSKAIERLLGSEGTVHLITDNFGTELAMDLGLADTLLEMRIPVIFHVKMNPTYVSDATASDVFWMLENFRGNKTDYFIRLKDAWQDGRFKIAPNFFWNSPHFLNKLPSHLMQLFSDARLIILKGDANYRRAFFDTIWPVDTPANEIVNYLPAPMLCLRTIKSDCLAGVPKELAAKAEANNPKWRLLGKYGLIQYIAR